MDSGLILGCGYLGRRVAQQWLAQGRRVVAVTRSNDRAAQLKQLGIEPIVGDVTRPGTLVDLPPAETVLWAVGYDRTADAEKRTVYVDGVGHVIAALNRRVQRFIHVSSISVYGDSDGGRVDEQTPCEPVSDGGRICREAERVVLQWNSDVASERQPQRVILRLAGIYGPDRVLAKVDALRAGEPIAGNPDAWLNLIHVDDAVQAVIAAEHQPGGLFVVSDSAPVQRRHYYAHLAQLLNAPLPVFDESQPSRTRGLNKRCRNRLMREQLGVELCYPTYEEGLRQVVEETM